MSDKFPAHMKVGELYPYKGLLYLVTEITPDGPIVRAVRDLEKDD